jgi:cyclophilin family peptidyl-prolyl cis-trans isomerase
MIAAAAEPVKYAGWGKPPSGRDRRRSCVALICRQVVRMLLRAFFATFALIAFVGAGAAEPAAAPRPEPIEPALPDGLYAKFTTPRGVIVAELRYQKAPLTVTNFVGLAEGTLGPAPRKPFFNGLTFHRVVPDFVVQGGDPQGTGEGGPGYTFPDEFAPGLHHDTAGVLSMANDGPDTNGSQFFFILREVKRLDYLHSVFGRVTRGLEVLPSIKQGDPMQVKILRVGPSAQAFRADEVAFAALLAKTPKYTGPPEPGPAALFDDPDKLLPADPPRAKNFNFKLANFERATGLRVAVRVYHTFQPTTPGEQVNDLRARLVRELGVEKRGALAFYFADTRMWSLWIGDEQVPAFNPRGLKLHECKQAFIAEARQRAAATQAYVQKMSGPDKPLTDVQKLKLEVDEVIDGLTDLFAAR